MKVQGAKTYGFHIDVDKTQIWINSNFHLLCKLTCQPESSKLYEVNNYWPHIGIIS